MDVFLLRHGEALDRAEAADRKIPDPERALTAKGNRDVRRVIKWAKAAGVELGLILTSPYRRAEESAAIVSGLFPDAKVGEMQSLAPNASPEETWREMREHMEKNDWPESVLLAGHEPHLSGFLDFLLQADFVLDFKKGALCRIQLQSGQVTSGEIGSGGILRWIITPRLAKVMTKTPDKTRDKAKA